MMLLSRLVATLIDVATLLGMAAGLGLLTPVLRAVHDGVAPPPWRQAWDDLVKLSRKRRLRPGFASPLYAAWPVIAVSASGAALLVVPGFSFGLITAPLATVPLLAGLLALALGARLAAWLESGEGGRGAVAAEAALRVAIGLLVWLLVLGALAVRAGSDRLDAIGGLLAATPANAALVLLAGIALALTSGCLECGDPADYAGPERALFRIEAMLRRIVLLSIVLAVIAPLPMADSGLAATWPVGLAAWIVKAGVLGLVLIWLAPRRFAIRLGVAAAIGCLAVMLAQTVAVATLLIWGGGVLVLAGLIGLLRRGAVQETAGCVQLGVASIGFGLGATDGALLILATIALARLAGGTFASTGLIALLPLPPFGAFTGDAAVLRGAFRLDVWLGGAVLAAVVLTAAIALARQPPARFVMPPARRALPAALLLLAAAALGLLPWLIALPA
ncbi:hypothetical protein AruPA_04585 [Acidiphilium sp. PA]|uniref:hypothetical protein n=1 Tax=Acidiphilium sp. PA TaxID=2871705 RepID=UPI00224469E5|nr:hypothetical protein [Acidiphilium sp. PA]MCW8306306.1 hypothetical protein [Acidiphilium sp. PA]